MPARTITPQSCTQCERTKICRSHYGGLGCGYKEEIEKARKEKDHEEKII